MSGNKITDEQRHDIARDYWGGMRAIDVAEKHSVSIRSVYYAANKFRFEGYREGK